VAPPAPPAPKGPERRGGDVMRSSLIHQVTPVYPVLARQIRLGGEVQMEAVITREGAIRDLRTLSGHPLLVPAAEAAVRQWRYRPTLLNGEPVEVITTVTVVFRLN
jgi:protein TonB